MTAMHFSESNQRNLSEIGGTLRTILVYVFFLKRLAKISQVVHLKSLTNFEKKSTKKKNVIVV